MIGIILGSIFLVSSRVAVQALASCGGNNPRGTQKGERRERQREIDVE